MTDIHQIVLEAFCGPCPDGMEVLHGNGIRTDNRLWWLGDWWSFGEHQYGDLVRAAEESEWSAETIRAAAWVAKKVEPVRRLTVLTWQQRVWSGPTLRRINHFGSRCTPRRFRQW